MLPIFLCSPRGVNSKVGGDLLFSRKTVPRKRFYAHFGQKFLGGGLERGEELRGYGILDTIAAPPGGCQPVMGALREMSFGVV